MKLGLVSFYSLAIEAQSPLLHEGNALSIHMDSCLKQVRSCSSTSQDMVTFGSGALVSYSDYWGRDGPKQMVHSSIPSSSCDKGWSASASASLQDPGHMVLGFMWLHFFGQFKTASRLCFEDPQCGASLGALSPLILRMPAPLWSAFRGRWKQPSLNSDLLEGSPKQLWFGHLAWCLFKFYSITLFYLITLVWHAARTLVASKADNCVRENKNRQTCLPCFSAELVIHMVRLVSWLGLEKVCFEIESCAVESCESCEISFDSGWSCLIWDQLFGLLATAMRYVDILCDEQDLCEHLGIELLKFHWSFNCVDCLVCLQSSLEKETSRGCEQLLACHVRKIRYMLDRINVRAWIGPQCEIQVAFLDSVIDWKQWCFARIADRWLFLCSCECWQCFSNLHGFPY